MNTRVIKYFKCVVYLYTDVHIHVCIKVKKHTTTRVSHSKFVCHLGEGLVALRSMSQEKSNMAFSTATGPNFGGIVEPLWRNGPSPGALHSFPGGMSSSQNLPLKHTL